MIEVSARRKKQRGTQMLESALCFLPMFAMFFGIIDVCFAVSIQSLFSASVRAGARWAITYQTTYDGNTCTSQAACMTQVVQDNAVGFLAGTKSNFVVVNYFITNNLTTPVMVCNAGTCKQNSSITFPYTYTVNTVSGNTTGTTTVTVNYANQPGNIVEVTIPAYPLLWMVPITGYGGFGTTGYSAGGTVTDSAGKKGLGLVITASAADVLGGLAQGTVVPPTP
jgi:Flp pilus assembly protein TadG